LSGRGLYCLGEACRRFPSGEAGWKGKPRENVDHGRRRCATTATTPRTSSAPCVRNAGVGAAIIMPAVNSEAMAEHLEEISSQITPGAHAVLLLDGAGWHQPGKRLPVPDNISLLPLPAYSPELNPMENIWKFLQGNSLSHRVWNTYEAILKACRDAWNKLMHMPERIASLTQRSWAKPVSG
jgi:transposase